MPGTPHRARLKDVAALAGVSVRTVSNVVNDYPYITAHTRERVENAIAELGYTPNLAARGLRNGRSGVITLAVPELDTAYFSELAHHVVRAASDRGWTVLVDETEGLAERERLVAAGIRGHLIDGIILSPLALTDDDLAARRDRTPLVLLGERVGAGVADHVGVDNVRAACEAVTHLLDAGRRRIAVIGTQRSAEGRTARLRAQGYRDALRRAGLPVERDLQIAARSWHRAAGAHGVERLLALDPLPDAVFCLNDLLALGAMRALQAAGLRVPDDVAVVGFDDIEEGRYSTPTLTTIAPDKQAIARTAVDRLARQLNGSGADASPAEPDEIVVGHELCVRESSTDRPAVHA
jgi:DNA-binding LacI/PurR family transcriptional regulator